MLVYFYLVLFDFNLLDIVLETRISYLWLNFLLGNIKQNHEKICIESLSQDNTCTKETNEFDQETLQA